MRRHKLALFLQQQPTISPKCCSFFLELQLISTGAIICKCRHLEVCRPPHFHHWSKDKFPTQKASDMSNNFDQLLAPRIRQVSSASFNGGVFKKRGWAPNSSILHWDCQKKKKHRFLDTPLCRKPLVAMDPGALATRFTRFLRWSSISSERGCSMVMPTRSSSGTI